MPVDQGTGRRWRIGPSDAAAGQPYGPVHDSPTDPPAAVDRPSTGREESSTAHRNGPVRGRPQRPQHDDGDDGM